MAIRTIKMPARMTRTMPLDRAMFGQSESGATADPNAPRTFRSTVASEALVERWDYERNEPYLEEIGMTARECDSQYLDVGAAVLLEHDRYLRAGISKSYRFTPDGKLETEDVFSNSPLGRQTEAEVEGGFLPQVSMGYGVRHMKETRPAVRDQRGNVVTPCVMRADDWIYYEKSYVSVAADTTVGPGRAEGMRAAAANEEMVEVQVEYSREETDPMDPSKAVPNAPANTDPPANNPTPNADGTRAQHVPAQVFESPAERAERVRQIRSLCREHAVEESKITDFIAEDRSFNDVQGEVLKLARERQANPTRVPSSESLEELLRDAGMPVRDQKRYSLIRHIDKKLRAIESQGQIPIDGAEADADKLMRSFLPTGYRGKGGIFPLPSMRRAAGMQKRAADSTTAGNLAEFVHEQFGDRIEYLYPALVAGKLGVTFIDGVVGNGPLSLPRHSGIGSASWVGEGGTIAATDEASDQVLLTPKRLASQGIYSRDLLAQTSPAFDSLMEGWIVRREEIAIDSALFHGTGVSNQPTGICQTPGVNTSAMGGQPTFVKIVAEMEGKVLDANVYDGNFKFVLTPLLAASLATVLQASAAGATFILTGRITDGTIGGYPAMATNSLSKVMSTLAATGGTSHGFIFGNWSAVKIARWLSRELIVNPFSLDSTAQVRITSHSILDIAIDHPAAFTVATGATP